MLGRIKAFFTRARAQTQERIAEADTAMTAQERQRRQAGSSGGAAGEVEGYFEREADRNVDVWEGRPPAP
jgi:hypothetical protein